MPREGKVGPAWLAGRAAWAQDAPIVLLIVIVRRVCHCSIQAAPSLVKPGPVHRSFERCVTARASHLRVYLFHAKLAVQAFPHLLRDRRFGLVRSCR